MIEEQYTYFPIVRLFGPSPGLFPAFLVFSLHSLSASFTLTQQPSVARNAYNE
ncbi:hypothetical protein EJ08DRAFT_648488 [Tothia fuscella]|uniref:Uncharacterized protein n=1 Tax=Tothia fuscella TaxID=1048955 RepID=A0A9P4NU92_9PEZI|nr:hypothetical protein EJ08DRAFT_648488 [Tothia fuscella]